MKHLDIIWTNQFKKDYKAAIKRHLNIDLLDDIIRKLSSGETLQRKIEIMLSQGIGPGTVSVIFSRIGCWSTG